MAGIAGSSGFKVIRRLPWRSGTVVAARASALYHACVIEFCRLECCSGMANAARLTGRHVGGRHHCRAALRTLVVAACAGSWRARKYTADMAGFAANRSVCA